jgi:hypothetical protein
MSTYLAAVRWQLRQLIWINLAALLCAVGFILFWHEALEFLVTPWVVPFVALHSGLVVMLLGRNGSSGTRFLYAQGLTRDQVWWSTYSVSLISGLVVCGSVWLILILGIRSQLQDWMQNPWFPFMATEEPAIAGWLLLEYVLLLPLLHYVWVRSRQPMREAGAGWLICVAGLVMLTWSITELRRTLLEPTLFWIALVGFLSLAGLLMLVNWRLHRDVEVRS